jgi:hypothetical protein
MSDIKGQLIKNSYNYVLQSDLITGIVYRIGGDVPTNPKFISGLTINSSLTYSDGSELDGYVLTCDVSGNATWKPVSAATPSSGVTSVTATNGMSGNVTTGAIILVNTAPDQIVTISGGTGITTGGTYPNFTLINSAPDQTVTITGGTKIQITGTYPNFGVNYTGATIIQGITGITGSSGVSAITNDYGTSIVNTAPDQIVTISGGTGITTGGTYPNFTLVNSAPDRTVIITGGTNIQITGTYPDFGVNFTGTTGSNFTGGTVSGPTDFTNGLTANTISATTYYNYPDTYVTGFTLSSNTITLSQNRTDSYSSFTISLSAYTGSSVSGDYLPLSGGTLTGGLTALTISAITYLGNVITNVTSVGSGTPLYDSTSSTTANIRSITSDTTNKVSVSLNAQTINLGINEQNLTLWNLVVQGNKLLNGSVSYVSGLTFSVSPLEYLINGVIYNITGQTTVTLTSGDSTFDRIDVIYADISGNTGILKGVPSVNPEKPLVDGDTQVEVTFVLVGANSTSANISNFTIYNENSGPPTEWRFSTGGTQSNRIIGNFTGTTYSGGTSIRVSGITGTTYTTFFTLSGITQLDTNSYPSLQFAIRNLSANTTTSQIRFRFLTSTGAQNGTTVFMNGAGTANFVQYSSTNVSTWQLISIPIWRFYLTNTNVQVLEVSFNPGTGTQSRYLFDTFEFVSGLPTTPPANAWTAIQTETTGSTVTPLSPNATLTITGGTNIQVQAPSGSSSLVVIDTRPNIRLTGLTANTISATTYYNLPVAVTGFTLSANTITLSQNRTDSYSSFTISLSGYVTNNIFSSYTASTQSTINNKLDTSGFTAYTASTQSTINNKLDTSGFTAYTATTQPLILKSVTGGTYSNGTLNLINNSGTTIPITGFAIGGGGGQLFYLNLSQSKNGNRYLSTTASTGAEQSTGVTIDNGATGTMASFQSDQLGVTLIPGGVWAFYLHSYRQDSNSSFNIFVEVYKRTSGGTETLLFTTDPAPVTSYSPTITMELTDAYFSGCPLVITDSIIAKVRATNTSNQSHSVTLFSEGSQHYSYGVSSIPTQQGLTCETLSGCSVIQTIQGDVQTIQSNISTIQGDITIIQGEIIGTSQQIAYYNVDGKLTGDTGFTRQDETNNSTTIISNVSFTNIAEHQDTGIEYNRVRSRVYNDDISLFAETNLNSTTYFNTISNTTGSTASGLDISENGGSLRYKDKNDNYNGFNYTNNSVGWSVIVGSDHYFYNFPQSVYVANGVLTDVSGNGNLTWVVPTSSTFTGGTVSGATNFTGGLTANTIFATNYLNLPTDIRTTGATYSNNTFTYINNGTGGTFNVLFNTVTGLTVNGNLTVTGDTTFIKINTSGMSVNGDISVTGNSSLKGVTATGLTVNGNVTVTGTTTTGTISATTYQNLPTYISAVTESANVFTVSSNSGGPTTLIVDAVTGGTYSAGQITLSGTGNVNGTQISTKILPVALTVVSNTASTDASLSSLFTLTLTGNTTLATPNNGFSGQRIVYRLRQDGTGSKTLTLSSGFRSGPITVTLSTAANTTDYLGVIYNEIDNEWDVLALNKGYS